MLYDMLSEGDDGAIYFRLYLEKVLKKLPKNARILDCSCGTGNHAIWLARQGFKVFASDISEGMIACAAKKAEKEGLDINFFRSSWEEIPSQTNTSFDLVICPGNSLSHITDLSMLGQSVKAFRKIIKAGGRFFFDLRNWEKTFEENSLRAQKFQVKSKKEIIDVRYSYKINGWNVASTMFVDVCPAGTLEKKRYAFDFIPIGYLQLRQAFLKDGFEHVERGFYPDGDYYFAIAK